MAAQNGRRPAIVFDFGGVLMDWNPWYLYRRYFHSPEEMQQFFDEVGFIEWNQKQDAGRPFAEAVQELCSSYPQHAELIRAYDQYWEESIAGPFPATVDLLRRLMEAGYHLYGLSNWSAEKFRIIRQKYPFFEWFADIIVSGEVKLVKPDPSIFALLLDRAGRPAEEVILIDDSLSNIETARRMGFRTVHFQTIEQVTQDLAELGIKI